MVMIDVEFECAFEFDDDAFDLEVRAERMQSTFTTEEVATYFGVHRVTVATAVQKGRIPPAALRGELETDPCRWTALQVLQIEAIPWPSPRHLAARAGGADCGTWQKYNRHLRDGEKPCEPCYEAARVWRREHDSTPEALAKKRARNARRKRARMAES
jgi:excisionase family DNA binding protein